MTRSTHSVAPWRIGPDRTIELDAPVIIGIINVTPDSFYEASRQETGASACARAVAMVRAGARVLDLGGESTRPGAGRVGVEEQLRRVVPAIRAIRSAGLDVPISVDTTRVEVARAALDAGANIINDVSGGEESGGAVLRLAAERGTGLILMHRLRSPDADSFSNAYAAVPVYEGGVVRAVCDYLRARVEAALGQGVAREAIALDPGLGFGKTVEQNHALIAHIDEVVALGCPVLCAVSRKSFVGIGRSTEPALPISERLAGSVQLACAMRAKGARLFRVHDVSEHVAAFSGFGVAMCVPRGTGE